jgi:hypothetical protein
MKLTSALGLGVRVTASFWIGATVARTTGAAP